jgi:hypothetical protein
VKGLWAVLCREIAERRLLLLGAAVMGLFPLLMPFLPGVDGRYSTDLRAGTAFALCFVVAAVLAVTLGSSVIAGELAERRLGFYFARPIAGWSIWAGKLAGASVLCLGAGFLVLLPTLLVNPRIELGTPAWMGGAWIHGVPVFLPALAAGCATIVLLSHLVSTMVRSRSPWLLLDLGAALAVAALFWSARQVLLREGAEAAWLRGLAGFVTALVAAALVASAIQVTRGRTDPRRGHRLLSLTFWAALGAAAAGLAAFSHWVVTVSPRDLAALEVVLPSPAGPWIGLRGPAAGRGDYFPAFLLDIASGRSVKSGVSPAYRFWWLQPVFAPDGSRAAWVEGRAGSFDLRLLDLTRPGARPTASAVSFGEWPLRMALSPGGRLFASLQSSSLTVDDLATGRLLAAVPLAVSFEEDFQLRFADDGHLRVYQASSERAPGGGATWQLAVLDLEPGHGRLDRVGGIKVPGSSMRWALSRDGRRAALLPRSGGPVLLADLGTGTVIATLPSQADVVSATFLTDGRLLLDERTLGSVTLRVMGQDGAEQRRFPFPMPRLVFGGEVGPGLLTLGTTARGSYADPAGWTSFLLNLDDGRTTPIGQGLIPVSRGAVGPPSLGPRLFLRTGGELVYLDPATGRLRTVLHVHGA